MPPGATFRGVNLAHLPGEILGLSGLAGAGHEELASVLFGAMRPRSGGSCSLRKGIHAGHPSDARRAGGSAPCRRIGVAKACSPRRASATTRRWRSCPGSLDWAGSDRRPPPSRGRRPACRDFEVSCARSDQPVLTLSGGQSAEGVAGPLVPDRAVPCPPSRADAGDRRPAEGGDPSAGRGAPRARAGGWAGDGPHAGVAPAGRSAP